MFQKIANAYEVCWEGLYIVYKTLISIAISTVLYQLLFRVVSDLKPSFLLLSDIEGWWTERKLQLHVG